MSNKNVKENEKSTRSLSNESSHTCDFRSLIGETIGRRCFVRCVYKYLINDRFDSLSCDIDFSVKLSEECRIKDADSLGDGEDVVKNNRENNRSAAANLGISNPVAEIRPSAGGEPS